MSRKIQAEKVVVKRCRWVNEKNPFYVKYHDEEWGVPSYEDGYLFEMLVLEMFQAGLSWECVLNKREAFRDAFDGFCPDTVRGYEENKIQELMQNAAIIRNQRKIRAAVGNAAIFCAIQQEFGSFSDYIWGFTGHEVVYRVSEEEIASSALSDKISADLKRRGMKFVGTVIVYSYLQAIGVVNDHECQCSWHKTQIDI